MKFNEMNMNYITGVNTQEFILIVDGMFYSLNNSTPPPPPLRQREPLNKCTPVKYDNTVETQYKEIWYNKIPDITNFFSGSNEINCFVLYCL